MRHIKSMIFGSGFNFSGLNTKERYCFNLNTSNRTSIFGEGYGSAPFAFCLFGVLRAFCSARLQLRLGCAILSDLLLCLKAGARKCAVLEYWILDVVGDSFNNRQRSLIAVSFSLPQSKIKDF